MAVPDVIRECMMVTMLFLMQLESTTGHIEHKIHRAVTSALQRRGPTFGQLEQEMATGRNTSEQVRHACDDVMVLLICFCMNQTHPLSQADGFLMVHTIVK